MNGRAMPHDQRIQQLLADRATEGLDNTAEVELSNWLDANPLADADGLELAAAAILIALGERSVVSEPLSESVRIGIRRDARVFFAGKDVAASASPVGNALDQNRRTGVSVRPLPAIYRIGWYAAAACLLLAVAGWLPGVRTMALRSGTDRPPASASIDGFTRVNPDVTRLTWTPNLPEYQGVSGEIIWSDRAQSGFMRLSGMPVNDPTIAQYQLWIVDPRRDERPVDGGVFDISGGGGEVVIPIRSKLLVSEPVVFAITREKPGGVVVSAGPHLLVAAVR